MGERGDVSRPCGVCAFSRDLDAALASSRRVVGFGCVKGSGSWRFPLTVMCGGEDASRRDSVVVLCEAVKWFGPTSCPW